MKAIGLTRSMMAMALKHGLEGADIVDSIGKV